MTTPHNAVPQIIVILKADQLYAEILRQIVQNEFSGARVSVTASTTEAELALRTSRCDLFITGLSATSDGDVLDLLYRHNHLQKLARRIMVVTSRREFRLLTALKNLGVDGVFDALAESPDRLIAALRAVTGNTVYWSPSIIEHLRRIGSATTTLFRMLTNFEQMVLSVIGDGSDDQSAALELGLSTATICSVRRELHRKLGVQHRGALVRLAAQHGFVRFTPSGVVRPGFALLAAAHQAKRAKRATVVAKFKTALPSGLPLVPPVLQDRASSCHQAKNFPAVRN